MALTGEVRKFWTQHFYVYTAECRVLLQAYEVASGRKLWEKEYAKKNSEDFFRSLFLSEDTLRDNLAATAREDH